MRKLILSFIITLLLCSQALAEDISIDIQTSDTKIVKDAIMSVMSHADGLHIKSTDDYHIVMEKEYTNGAVAFFAMDLHTGRKPVMRLYFDIMPLSNSTKVKIYANNIVSPDSNHEEMYPVTNKKDIEEMRKILVAIKSSASQMTTQEIQPPKPKEEKFVDHYVVTVTSSDAN